MPGAGYKDRTRKNVEDSDGTLILFDSELSGGSLLTYRMCTGISKPCMPIMIDTLRSQPDILSKWINEHSIKVLNVAGPRESKCPGIHSRALIAILTAL